MATFLPDPLETLFNLQRSLDTFRSSAWLQSGPSAGGPYPPINVFRKDGGKVRHFWASEMLYADTDDPAQGPRHVDAIWPMWNIFDVTPEGRGDWNPKLAY